MNTPKTKENREHTRIGIDVAVEVHSAPGSDALEGNTIHCYARDISLTGMCIYTPMHLLKGSSLLLRLELGVPAYQFNLLGKVIWSEADQASGQYKTGIHLVKMPTDSAAWHTAVIQKLIG